MADANPPANPGTDVAPATEQDHVAALENLLEPPETDQPDESEEPEAAQQKTDEDDPLGLDTLAEDVAEDAADETDGPDAEIKGGRFAPDSAKVNLDDGTTITIAEIKGGRFAPDSAKVNLDDGTTITIAELKRNNLFQRDYTSKTQALSEERKTLDAEREQWSQYAQSLSQSRDYLAWYAETQVRQKQPEPFKGDALNDPAGFMKWQQDMSEWQTHLQAYQSFMAQRQSEDTRKTGESEQQTQAQQQQQLMALRNAMPVLNDPVKGKAALDALEAGATRLYGYTAEDLKGKAFKDHRDLLVLRDALAFHRIKEKAPKVQEQIAAKPVTPGKRNAPQAVSVKARQERTERLRKSGSFEDGVASLTDFNL